MHVHRSPFSVDMAHMGGISQDVKTLKSGIFTFSTLGFLDHLHFCCFDENHHVFKAARSESYYVML